MPWRPYVGAIHELPLQVRYSTNAGIFQKTKLLRKNDRRSNVKIAENKGTGTGVVVEITSSVIQHISGELYTFGKNKRGKTILV